MFEKNLLRAAARAHGIQCSYKNVEGTIVWSPEKTLVKILEELTRQKIQTNNDLAELYSKKLNFAYEEKIKPCHVFWGGASQLIQINSLKIVEENINCEIVTEEGLKLHDFLNFIYSKKTSIGFKSYFHLKTQLSVGYHKLIINIDQKTCSSFLICPPEKLEPKTQKAWGPFVPLYALKSPEDWGIGSFKEAATLAKTLRPFGGNWMGLLPMLAGNFDHQDCDPSPYSSLSRLFWNEIYLDVDQLVEKYNLSSAKEIISSATFQKRLEILRLKTHVDYFGVYQTKKEILLLLSDEFFAKKYDQHADYLEFEKQNDTLSSYVKFRSKEQREQNFHKFVQFEMDCTLRNFSKNNNFGLYMDYPVGVNDSGFDYQEFRSVFFGEVSVGAPPEPVFALGQDWGFPAFHPAGMQKDHYQYFRKSLQHHLKFCKILRLDHIMGLHRIYSVPKGFKGNEGAYLRFAPEELFAVVILEAHRAGADLIGENLGTVPLAVDKILNERNMSGMWVMQCETWRDPEIAFQAIKENMLVCINTHDMPMFNSFKKGSDLDLISSLNILSDHYKTQFQQERKAQLANWESKLGSDMLNLAIEKIAQSSAKYFVVNLEDLWGEEMPQNIPGTWKEYPNWRKKFSLELNEISKNPKILKTLSILKEFRNS